MSSPAQRTGDNIVEGDKPTMRSDQGKTLVLVLLLLFIPCAAVWSETGSEDSEAVAENAENAWSDKGIERQISWLAAHRDHDLFFDRILKTASAAESPEQGMEVLSRFLPILSDADQRYTVLLKLAHVEESLGKLESAQTHYQAASSVRSGSWDYRAMFSSAMLLLELGNYSLAELQLARIRDKAVSEGLVQSATVQTARLAALRGDLRQAERIVSEIIAAHSGKLLSPRDHYLLYTLCIRLDMHEEAGAVKQDLVKSYPRSPEAGMVQGLVDRAPSTEHAFGLLRLPSSAEKTESPAAGAAPDAGAAGTSVESTSDNQYSDDESAEASASKQKVRGIQAGSFRDAENAEYMAVELEKKGFETRIEEALISGTVYHRVVVPIPEEGASQKIILELKEEGFEGYPIY